MASSLPIEDMILNKEHLIFVDFMNHTVSINVIILNDQLYISITAHLISFICQYIVMNNKSFKAHMDSMATYMIKPDHLFDRIKHCITPRSIAWNRMNDFCASISDSNLRKECYINQSNRDIEVYDHFMREVFSRRDVPPSFYNDKIAYFKTYYPHFDTKLLRINPLWEEYYRFFKLINEP